MCITCVLKIQTPPSFSQPPPPPLLPSPWPKSSAMFSQESVSLLMSFRRAGERGKNSSCSPCPSSSSQCSSLIIIEKIIQHLKSEFCWKSQVALVVAIKCFCNIHRLHLGLEDKPSLRKLIGKKEKVTQFNNG